MSPARHFGPAGRRSSPPGRTRGAGGRRGWALLACLLVLLFPLTRLWADPSPAPSTHAEPLPQADAALEHQDLPPLPIALLCALEDQQFTLAREALTPILAQFPDALALQALAIQLQAGEETEAFLRTPSVALEPDAKESLRFADLQARLTRVELERRLYRGDRGRPRAITQAAASDSAASDSTASDSTASDSTASDSTEPPPAESAADFQARLEQELAALETGFQALLAADPDALRLRLSLAQTRKLRGTLSTDHPLSAPEARVPRTAWDTWWLVSAIEAGVFPPGEALPWLEQYCPNPATQDTPSTAPPTEMPRPDIRLPSPLEHRCLLLTLELQVRALDWDQAAQRYADVLEQVKPSASPWLDDLFLAAGRTHARGYTPSTRDTSVALLKEAAQGDWRSSTHPATLELSGQLRRQRRFEEALAVVEDFHARFPQTPWRLEREEGRIAFQLDQHERAIRAFEASIAGPWGKGGDYLLLAEATRAYLSSQLRPSQEDRRKLLTLTDFAQAALEQEARVVGWINRRPGPVTELYARLTELNVLVTHAALFPMPFVVSLLSVFWQALAVALGVLLLASYARRTQVLWKPMLLATLGLLYLPLLAAIPLQTTVAEPTGAGMLLAFTLQSGIRLFFVIMASRMLGGNLGLNARGLVRWGRILRLPLEHHSRKTLQHVALGGLLLVLLGLIVRGLDVSSTIAGDLGAWWPITPGVYLERFPALLVGAELGAPIHPLRFEDQPGGAPWAASLALQLFHGIQVELLARGVVLGGTLFVLGWTSSSVGTASRWKAALAVGAAALVSASLELGAQEPAGTVFVLSACAGAVLGYLRLTGGLSASLIGLLGWKLLLFG